MDLQQVRYCLAIAEERSFGRAAEKCGVRQPSVSNAVRRLESQLGGELFLRSRPVQSSKLGKALLPIFAQINKLAEKAQKIAGVIPASATSLSASSIRSSTTGR